jgi:hypothetical protein
MQNFTSQMHWNEPQLLGRLRQEDCLSLGVQSQAEQKQANNSIQILKFYIL